MTPAEYVLCVALFDGLPTLYRAACRGKLAMFEPHPQAMQEAALELHTSGHLRAGHLTPDGMQAAQEALSRVVDPPGSERKVAYGESEP